MTYKIKDYSYNQAKKLNVKIKPSTNPNKKIDVFNNDGLKLASIGAVGYNDYPSYLEKDKKLAEIKRQNYWKRHKNNVNNKNGAGYYSARILW